MHHLKVRQTDFALEEGLSLVAFSGFRHSFPNTTYSLLSIPLFDGKCGFQFSGLHYVLEVAEKGSISAALTIKKFGGPTPFPAEGFL